MRRKIVVVGNGMVGSRFAAEIARRDPAGAAVEVTVLGAEPGAAYNRILLSAVASGRMSETDIELPRAAGPGVTVRAGIAAAKLDLEHRQVLDAEGEEHPYDELVLATGAAAAFPPVDGLGTPADPAPGVTALRDLDDCRRLAALIRPGAPIVVLGGGVLGLEAARALVACGVRVTVVEAAPWLMNRQLDQAASTVVADRMKAFGIEVHGWRVVSRWRPGSGLELDDRRVLAADALVVAAGVRPRVELAAEAGIAVDRGIVIDDRCTTSDPRVHAIGDCAQHPGGGFGLVGPGWRQAEVLADLLSGASPSARYAGSRPVTRLKADGLEVTSLGDIHDESAPKVTISDRPDGRYAMLATRDDRVTGAILVDFPEAAATVTQLYHDQAPVPTDRLGLLLGRSPAASAAPAASALSHAGGSGNGLGGGGGETTDPLVCHCNAVTRSRIESAWLDGAHTRADIATETRATTGCGGCIRDVDSLIAGLGSTGSRQAVG